MRLAAMGPLLLSGVAFVFFFLPVLQADNVLRSPSFEQEHFIGQNARPFASRSYDPAAPGLPCDTACHSRSPYQREEMHQTEACTTCHMTTEALEHDASAKKHHAQSKAMSSDTSGRRRIEGVLVERQDEARRRLKGQPMQRPQIALTPPEDMVLVPEGEFIMGTNTRWEDEGPEHVVYLHSYFIDRYEVTNADYKKFVTATGYRSPDHWRQGGYPDALAHHPVTYVTWYDALAYCQWSGKRLPSEEEWEKAARGTDGRQYPWGNTFYEERSNNPQNKSKGTVPIGSYESGKSPFGLYDMSGNVWEWVDAWYQPHPGNDVPSEEYGKKHRVSKGGSWYNCLFYNCGISAPAYNRAFLVPATKNASLGFRCVQDVSTSLSQ